MRAIVTGSEGFIGKLLVTRLKEDGHEVRGHDTIYYPEQGASPPQNIDYERYDVVYHLGAISGVAQCADGYTRCLLNNVLSTAKWAETAAKVGARFVFASSAAAASCGEYCDTLYGSSKYAAETLCRTYGKVNNTDVTILRFSNVYGPGSVKKTSVVAKMFKDAFSSGRIEMHDSGLPRRDFVYVDDVITALLESPPSGLYAVRTNTLTPVGDVASMVRGLTGGHIFNKLTQHQRAFDFNTADAALPISTGYKSLRDGLRLTHDYFRRLLNV